MPRFFVRADQVHDDRCVILPPDAQHLSQSLRTQPGEVISVADDAGTEHAVRVDVVERERVEGRILASRPVSAEPQLRVHVIQSLPQQGMDDAVDAMAQVGVAAIWPVLSDRSVARPDAARAAKRLERWRSIARESAGLAYRGAAPTVSELGALATAGTRILACSIGGATVPLTGLTVDPTMAVALCIGPEGGWSSADLAALTRAGAEAVHLGPRIYRSRLAGAIACSMLLAQAGDSESPATPIGNSAG